MRLYAYIIALAAACLVLGHSRGFCQQEQKDKEITWDDIEGVAGSPVSPAPAPVAAVQQSSVKEEPAQVTVQAPISAPTPAPVPAPQVQEAKKKAPAKKTRPSKKEENKWKRATTIINGDPAERDVFVTNPNRE